MSGGVGVGEWSEFDYGNIQSFFKAFKIYFIAIYLLGISPEILYCMLRSHENW